jgi:MoxR-like ATPase
MFDIMIDYPTHEEEAEIIRRTTAGTKVQLEPIMSAAQIIRLQDIVRKIPVSDNIIKYTVAIVAGTRPRDDNPYDFIKKWVRWGAGPRASQYIILGAKARAVIRGNYFVSHEDIKVAALPVLRHRIIPTFQAQSEGISTSDIIQKLVSTIKHN